MYNYVLLYKILAGVSSSGKLGGREVKTSALVSRRQWVRIPPELPVHLFPSTDTRKALGIIKSIVYQLMQEFLL